MQEFENKNLQILQKLGMIIKNVRKNKHNYSLNNLANEYDIPKGTLSRIENGKENSSIIILWKISNALGMKCSDLIKLAENELGEDFTLIDE